MVAVIVKLEKSNYAAKYLPAKAISGHPCRPDFPLYLLRRMPLQFLMR